MSYSNPDIYTRDPLAFAKSFGKSFEAGYRSVEDHISKVREQINAKNRNVVEQGEKIEDTIYKSKNLIGSVQNKLLDTTTNWMRSSAATEQRQGDNFLTRVASARATGPSAAQINKATSSAKGLINALNTISEYAVDFKKYKNTNRLSEDWATTQLAMDYFSKNPDAALYLNAENDGFSGTVTFPNPNGDIVGKDGTKYSSMPVDVLQAKLMTLKDIQPVIDQFTSTSETIKGAANADIKNKINDAKLSNEDLLINGEKVVRDFTEQRLRSLQVIQQNDSTGSREDGFIDNAFSNLVKIPYDIAPGQTIYTKTKKELFGSIDFGSTVVEGIDSIEDKETKEEAEGHLKAILDLPISDDRIDQHIKELSRLGIINNRDIQNVYDTVEEFQFQSVVEFMTNDVIAKGVHDGINLKKKEKQATKTVTDRTDINSEVQRVGANMSSFMTQVGSRARQDVGASRFMNLPAGKNFTLSIGGAPKEVEGSEFNPNTGEIKVVYKDKIINGEWLKPDKTFNIYDPAQMNNMWNIVSPSASGSSKSAAYYRSTGFKNEMLKYFTTEGKKDLEDPKYNKWFNWVIDNGGSKAKKELINYAATNPSLYGPGSRATHWVEYAKNNKNAILLAEERNK